MASILKVNELQGIASTGSISVTGEGNSTTTNLQQGLIKMWGKGASDGASLSDSFNVSSLGDTATGRQTYNYTNVMSSGSYSAHFSPGGSYCYSNAVEPAASSLSTRARNNLDALFDTGVHVSSQGDLA